MLYKLLQHGWQQHDLGMHSHSWVVACSWCRRILRVLSDRYQCFSHPTQLCDLPFGLTTAANVALYSQKSVSKNARNVVVGVEQSNNFLRENIFYLLVISLHSVQYSMVPFYRCPPPPRTNSQSPSRPFTHN
jgi:hypothetical protein